MKLLPVVVLLSLASVSIAQSNKAAQVARGKYLVRHVAMCGDCHTPRDEKGNPLPGKELAGSPLAFKPLAPMPWAAIAPAIAGSSGFKANELVTFLMTGKLEGASPRPPMPEYHLSSADAYAVVAYLRSLPGSSGPAKSTEAKKN
jgi:mono/diheme cytochrome c family protein